MNPILLIAGKETGELLLSLRGLDKDSCAPLARNQAICVHPF